MIFHEELRQRLIDRIDLSKNISDEELNRIISDMVLEENERLHMTLRERMQICKDLFNSIRGLDVLQEILEQEDVTEIMVNDFDQIFIEKKGKLYSYPGSFSSREKLQNVIQIIASGNNRRVNESTPILDARLSDGSRVNVVLPPISIKGPIVTIRKFPEKPIDMDALIKMGSITKEAAAFLKKCVENGCNIFISGGTGSGKTTFLNALSGYIPENERIITIEDSAELKITQVDNLVSLECRQANIEGENAVNIRELIRTSLRMRPTRIIVGEVRGGEALDMLQAMNTGHDGSLCTGHSNSPRDMLSRLEVMTLMAGEEIPLSAIRRQIASALDLIIHLGRTRDGSRKVMNISQLEGMDGDEIRISSLFEYDDALKRTETPFMIGKGHMDEI